jgi:hypothetical protein
LTFIFETINIISLRNEVCPKCLSMKEREPQFFQALGCLLCKIYCRELVKLAKAIARWAEKLSRNSIALNAIVF